MIENPTPTRRAYLVWQRPLDASGRRDRHAVAELTQMEDGVSFHYFGDEQLSEARQAGFMGYPGLPIGPTDLGAVAIEVLLRRLPPRDRADFNQLIAGFGLPPERDYSALTLLAYTGARLTSDSFSICETFDGFVEPFTYVFDVAGNRHYENLYGELEVGEPLSFIREPENEQDPNAVLIRRHNGTTVGYVNRLQAEVVGRWVNEDRISGAVFRVNGRAGYPRLFVRAEVSAQAHVIAA